MTKHAELEALLFYYGDPVTVKRLAELLQVSLDECGTLISELDAALRADEKRGLVVVRNGDTVQLATNPAFKDVFAAIVKSELRAELTPAARETLALIAYLGPVMKSTVDYVRGVNTSFSVRNLLLRGLIERDTSLHGHSYAYRVTNDFLAHLGIQSVESLPEYERYRTFLSSFSTGTETPEPAPKSELAPPEEPIPSA